MDERYRGTGRTSRALAAAPQGAVYIAPHHGAVRYTRDLAHKLGRGDLRVETPQWLERSMGMSADVVVDHAANLTERQSYELQCVRARAERRRAA